LPDGRPGPLRRPSSRRGGREDGPGDMGRHATAPWASTRRLGPKTRRTHCRQTRSVRSSIEIRRRPTLPGDLSPSTIGADRLNFRVRDGNGCDPVAMVTEISCQRGVTLKDSRASTSCSKPSPRPISTGRLNVLPRLHLRPINVMVSSRALLR
jgi:hypothetical protein